MSENSNHHSGKLIHSKFSSDSVKTVSDAKISTGAYGDLKQSPNFTQIGQEFKVRNGHHKLHGRNCNGRRYRQSKFYRCKNKGLLHPQTCSHTLNAKVCKTSPSLQQKSDLEPESNIDSPCKSDGINCSIKVNNGWQLKKVLNKLRCFSQKIVSDSNFSQIKIWDNSSERVGSISSNPISCRSWSSKKLKQKLPWTKGGASSCGAVTNQSSKSTNRSTNSSNSFFANETSIDSNKTLHTVHPVGSAQNLKSTNTIKNSTLLLGDSSEKSFERAKSKFRDKDSTSAESNKLNKSCFERLSCVKLKNLRSAPALLKNLTFNNSSFVEAPADREKPKVTLVVDKTCQTTSLILDEEKVTTSTSCTFEGVALYSDKETQNEISSFHTLTSSVNKMCQTESFGSLPTSDNKSSKFRKETYEEAPIEVTTKQSCVEKLSKVNELAAELIEAAFKEQKSAAKTLPEQKDAPFEHAASGAEKPFDIRGVGPVLDHKISPKCSCLKDSQTTNERPKRPEIEKLGSIIPGKCFADHKCTEIPEHEGCWSEKHVSPAGGKFSCQRNLTRAPKSLYDTSNHRAVNQQLCTSIGFIQQPSALKSSSSFLKVNFSRVDDPCTNHLDCYTCNLHKNPELWEADESCCFDFPLTRSNFLKLYPEPYINHLSNTISNVQLIFHKNSKNQKQLYVCQECKKNAAWNRHARKHRLSPKWRKSSSTLDSPTRLSVCSSTDAHSKQSPESYFYRHKKVKRSSTQRKKIKLKSQPRYENLKMYEDVGVATSRLELNQNQRRVNLGDDCCEKLTPSEPPPGTSPQGMTAELISPPPPPPLYEYPPYGYTAGEYAQTYPQGKQLSRRQRNRSPECAKPIRNERFSPGKDSLTRKKPQKSPVPHKHQSTRHSSPKRAPSSTSGISEIVVRPSDRRYEKEKAETGFLSYSKSSNYLLKYPGFGDCIPSQPMKFKPKRNSTAAETKARKKIKDKYRRDCTSVRCLIRDALYSERNSSYGKRNPTAEKPKSAVPKFPPKPGSNAKLTTLYEKNLDDFRSMADRNDNKSCTNRRPANKLAKADALWSSKTSFCVLSDLLLTSESVIQVSASVDLKSVHHNITKSKSTRWPKSNNLVKEQIFKRYSEEFTSQLPSPIKKRHASPTRENDTCEIFRNPRVKLRPSSSQVLELTEDLSPSDESLALYFKVMDVVAEKRRQFKKEERKRLKMQELRHKQTNLC